mmetsp:Transcript_25625/g.85403  ORF Transcript_25625/g.85403 Transcript_25625/m.85403 type:complete len:210 (-) Transcript_25625:1477-2106(-)
MWPFNQLKFQPHGADGGVPHRCSRHARRLAPALSLLCLQPGGMAVKAEQVRRRLRSDARLVLGAVLRLCAEDGSRGRRHRFCPALQLGPPASGGAGPRQARRRREEGGLVADGCAARSFRSRGTRRQGSRRGCLCARRGTARRSRAEPRVGRALAVGAAHATCWRGAALLRPGRHQRRSAQLAAGRRAERRAQQAGGGAQFPFLRVHEL